MNPIGGCSGTKFGCCPNSTTPKYNTQGTNCNIKGGCEGTMYGCCPDYITAKENPLGTNCPLQLISNLNGGCEGTKYGCCPNTTTPKINAQGTNCPPVVFNSCTETQYGCCPYSNIPKANMSGSNCPISPEDCEQSEYGCCPDGVTYSNQGGTNCNSNTKPMGGCSGTQYGCCPNGVTPKQDKYGSNCNNLQNIKLQHYLTVILEDLEDILVSPKFIFLILFFIIFYFIYVYLSKKETEQVSTSKHVFIVILFILLIFQSIVVGLYYIYNVNIYKKLGVKMKEPPTNNSNSTTSNPPANISPYKSSPAPIPEIKESPQVFNIPNNVYTYTDAKAICQAYGAELANYEQIDQAYNEGSEWCNYGWSDGQMILFPTQMSTFEELQKVKGHEHDCGRPGINGGYISNDKKRFGVNCYGFKPKITKQEEKIMANTSPIPVTKEEVMFEKEVDFWQKRLKDILVSPFNYNTWSKI